MKKGSEAGRRIAEMIKEGKIVPTQARTLLRSLDAPDATLTLAPHPEPRTRTSSRRLTPLTVTLTLTLALTLTLTTDPGSNGP